MQDATHIILPAHEAARAPIRARETVRSFLRRTQWNTERLPTICVLNGAPLKRKDWGRRLRRSDHLEFWSRPQGGGGAQGKQILGLVSLIALTALTGPLGAFLTPLVGGVAASFLGSAFLAGAAFAVNTLISPKAGGQDEDQGQVYTFGQRTNSARVMQTIPSVYGRVKRIPDYAAVPWAEFISNDQYLNILLVDGLGQYQREQILVDDTILWDSVNGVNSEFTGVEVDFYDPGEEITLFPLNVATSAEVSGQELPKPADGYVGGFIANAAGTTATALALDYVALGIYSTSEAGNIAPAIVPIVAEYRPVNDLGAPTGSWSVLDSFSFGGQTKKPKRVSRKIDVAPGRYEVRVKRTTNPSTDTGTSDAVAWGGLRAFLTGPKSFPGISTTAIRMKATQQLTSAASQKIGTITTRILPTWDGADWVDAATRSPAWAFLDAATNSDYGAKRSLSKVDLQAIVALDDLCTTRGDKFDYEFAQAVGVPEAFDTILKVCRSRHRWAGDVLTLVRDEWRDVPSMLLTDREIVRGSLAIDYQFAAADSADAVILEYVDETVWQPAEVQVPADYEATYPVRLQIPGIVQRDQAFREAGFLYRQNQYRRVRPSLDTEHDGRLISMGDQILVQSDVTGAWGMTGAVVAQASTTLTLEPAPEWAESGQHYVFLRSKIGGAFGPVKCAKGASDDLCVLDGTDLAAVEAQQGMTLAEVLARADGAELPSYAHGLGTTWQRRCIAMTGSMDGDHVSLQMVVDDERVHDESGAADALPALPTLRLPKAPVVAGLVATLEQNVLEPALSASWWPAAGATHYVAQVSYDAGESWETLAEARDPEASWLVEPRAMTLRVAAVGSSKGPWSSIDIAAPTISYEKVKITVANFEAGLRAYWESAVGGADERYEDLADALAASQMDASVRGFTSFQEERTTRIAQFAGVRAEFYESLILAVGPGSALAAQITSLEAQVGDVTASLVIKGVASVTWGEAVAAYDIKAQVSIGGDFVASGLRLGVLPDGVGGYTGVVYVIADQFYVGTADGSSFSPAFTLVGGNAYLNGNFIATGSITGAKIAAATIQGININAQQISAEKIVLNGVSTDRIALNAVTNIVQASSTSSFPSATLSEQTFISATITRTSGSTLSIAVPFEIRCETTQQYITVKLYRSIGGSPTLLKTLNIPTPAVPVSYVSYHDLRTLTFLDTTERTEVCTYYATIYSSYYPCLVAEEITLLEVKR